MIKLSAVIITFNEERNIERCIKSLLGVADEIIVLDSFSTDKTVLISESLGARVHQHKFDGHIEQKNRALTLASFNHILSLDADEALDESLKKAILDVKKKWNAGAYSMNRLTNYCGKWIYHCGWYPDTKLRLFDRSLAAWGGMNPHDKLILKSGVSQAHLPGNILHYSYYTLADHHKQIEHFSSIGAKAYYEKGRKASWLKLILSPVVKFIRDYLLKLGFLDGKAGFTISRLSAYATYLKYKKLRTLSQQTK